MHTPRTLLQGKKHSGGVRNRAKSKRGLPSDPEVFRRKLSAAMQLKAGADGSLCCEMCRRVLTPGDKGYISRGRSRHWRRLCADCGIAADARGTMTPVAVFLYEPDKIVRLGPGAS